MGIYINLLISVILISILRAPLAEASIQCYSCRYSANEGCDLKVDTNLISSTTTCQNECYTQISRSSDGSEYEVIRGCNTSPVCTDVSYSVGDQAYIVDCCDGDRCNDDLSRSVFECMQCSDTGGKDSTCPDGGFWDTKKSSIDTVYCTKFCEKEVRIDEDSKTVTRGCVDTCREESYSAFGIATYTYCCNNEDACNTGSSIEGVARHMVFMAGIVTVALTVLCRL